MLVVAGARQVRTLPDPAAGTGPYFCFLVGTNTIVIGHSPLPSPSTTKDLTAQRIGRSRPIAIELPSRRPSGPIYTPPEPLSARGDLPG